MPEKDALKVAVETTGSWGAVWQWIAGGIAAVCSGGWLHLTGRLKHLESNLVTAVQFKEHVEEEESMFNALDAKHDQLLERLTKVGEDVAFIKGRMK